MDTITVATLPTTDAERARVREDLGRELYRCLNRDTFVVAWDDLPDNRRERYRIAAVLFLKTEAVDTFLEAVRRRIAA
jgi:hypothetical protein